MSHNQRSNAVPTTAGIGLRGPHVTEILTTRPALGWLEVHPENYMGSGPSLKHLDTARRDYPISLHGVGLSLGTAEGVDRDHLARLKSLADRIEPFVISEHLSWSVTGDVYLNDLLPLPYTEETLTVVCRNVETVQDALGRSILVENPSSYVRFKHSAIPESAFIAEIARRTDCGILCDINNIYVSCENFGLDATAYLDALPAEAIGEIHLAGHFRTERQGRTLLIDDHGDRVAPAVWALYRHALDRFGAVPTLIEWDKQIPELAVLIAEARKADTLAHAALMESDNARVA